MSRNQREGLFAGYSHGYVRSPYALIVASDTAYLLRIMRRVQ